MARARDFAALPPEMSSTASAEPTTGDAVEKEEGSESGKMVATTDTGASHGGASASSSSTSTSSSPGSRSSACGVAHVASVPVPCAACGTSEVGSSRLAFFDMAVPHFGAWMLFKAPMTYSSPHKNYSREVCFRFLSYLDLLVLLGRAELVSFSCDDCGYKFNRVTRHVSFSSNRVPCFVCYIRCNICLLVFDLSFKLL